MATTQADLDALDAAIKSGGDFRIELSGIKARKT
jgi:hypothetical protein